VALRAEQSFLSFDERTSAVGYGASKLVWKTYTASIRTAKSSCLRGSIRTSPGGSDKD
jgi:hypothetical protein